jgi:hypothetical protein
MSWTKGTIAETCPYEERAPAQIERFAGEVLPLLADLRG